MTKDPGIFAEYDRKMAESIDAANKRNDVYRSRCIKLVVMLTTSLVVVFLWRFFH